MSARQREMTLRFMAAPTDIASLAGKIHAGRVLEWIDKAAYACAAAWAGGYCVTVYVGGACFQRPVDIGDIVEVHAEVVYTGRTSLHIRASVASGNPRNNTRSSVTECFIVFVAVDGEGNPVPVPTYVPRSLAELSNEESARERIGPRAAIQLAMEHQKYTEAGTAPRTLLRFLAAPTDINWGGKTHGGTIMRWIDEAATLCATRWTGRPALAVYAGGIKFHRPIHIGHVVEVEARMILTGHTSMHIAVHVRSSDPGTMDMKAAAHCHTLFTTFDASDRPLPVEPWSPVNSEDLRLATHAQGLNGLRQKLVGAPYPG